MKGCKNIVIMCMDYRFQIPMYSWLKHREIIGDCDVISVAGASLNLLKNTEHRTLILSQIELAHQKHGIERILIFHHEDCAAASDAPKDIEEEVRFHHEKMNLAEKVLVSHFPNVTVNKYFFKACSQTPVALK